jgi:hypothetical protein
MRGFFGPMLSAPVPGACFALGDRGPTGVWSGRRSTRSRGNRGEVRLGRGRCGGGTAVGRMLKPRCPVPLLWRSSVMTAAKKTVAGIAVAAVAAVGAAPVAAAAPGAQRLREPVPTCRRRSRSVRSDQPGHYWLSRIRSQTDGRRYSEDFQGRTSGRHSQRAVARSPVRSVLWDCAGVSLGGRWRAAGPRSRPGRPVRVVILGRPLVPWCGSSRTAGRTRRVRR